MRHWLLVLMVLLLPLRGLVGEAMAGQMLQHAAMPPPAQQAQAPHHAHALSLPGHDCDEQRKAQAQPEAPAAAEAQTPGDCPTCASCQVCSSVALGPSVLTLAAGRASQPPPQSVHRPYPSAEPALAFKPPRA